MSHKNKEFENDTCFNAQLIKLEKNILLFKNESDALKRKNLLRNRMD